MDNPICKAAKDPGKCEEFADRLSRAVFFIGNQLVQLCYTGIHW